MVEAAAAAADGEATLYLAEDSTLGALHGDTSRFATTATRCSADGLQLTPGPSVRTVTIAHVAQDCGTSAVALVRIATEGTEYEVLEGIGLLRPEVVVSEFFGRGHPRAAREAPGTNAMIEAMIARGYRRWIGLIEVGESLQVRRNPQTFPEDCAGCLFFFAANDVFSIAARWCDENLVGGCQ